MPIHSEMRYTYEIIAVRPAAGDGWMLRLFADGVEVGGLAFAVPEITAAEVDIWWNLLPENEREYWLMIGPENSAGVQRAYLLADAYAEAELAALTWLDRMTISLGGSGCRALVGPGADTDSDSGQFDGLRI